MACREGALPPRRLRYLFPETDIRQMTDSMTAKGMLERVGKRGGTCYQLSDEVIRSVNREGALAVLYFGGMAQFSAFVTQVARLAPAKTEET